MSGFTFEFDGTNWAQVPSSVPPTVFANAAFDRVRGRAVHLEYANTIKTWEWDGASWQHLATGSLTDTYWPLCYHAGRGRVVADTWFNSASGWVSELNEWDGSQWTVVPNSLVPPNHELLLTLAYDEERDKLVSFGKVSNGSYVNQTLEWDVQNGWVQVNAGGPQTFGGSITLTYDSSRRAMVLAGIASQIWERTSGGNWWQTGTGVNFGGTVVYDSRRRRSLCLNILGQTWSWEPLNPPGYDFHGDGCGGSLGDPTLSLTHPWTLPRPGSSLEATLDRLPLGVGAVMMGFDDQTFGGLPLPLGLGWLGVPSCALRVAPEVSVLVSGSGQSAAFSLPISMFAYGLVGLRFYQQGVSFDPGLNPLGVTLTNSMVGTVGF